MTNFELSKSLDYSAAAAHKAEFDKVKNIEFTLKTPLYVIRETLIKNLVEDRIHTKVRARKVVAKILDVA